MPVNVGQWTRDRIKAGLAKARNEQERAALMAHATTDGPCDAEYCPWATFTENMCARKSVHHRNCRCADCSMDDE